MIDLNEAGRRLAATRVAPTPPIATLHARRARRTRRRRIAATTLITTALAAIGVVSVLVTTGNHHTQRVIAVPPPTFVPNTVTLPPYPEVPGSTPYDFERLRLWLPEGWTTSTSLTCQTVNQAMYLPGNYQPTPTCATTATDRLVVQPLSAVPRTAAKMVINGITVLVVGSPVSVPSSEYVTFTWYIPSLDVQIIIAGTSAEAIAQTIEPSPLQHLLTDPLPVAVPSAWRTVTYDGFQAKVPQNWPTYRIVFTHTGNSFSVGPLPGVCGPPLFTSPSVYLGANVAISCPFIPEKTASPTDDGLWLQSSQSTAPLSSELAPDPREFNPERLITHGNTQILITRGSADDSAGIQIDADGRRIDAQIGLGINPATAEAILSSITPGSSG